METLGFQQAMPETSRQPTSDAASGGLVLMYLPDAAAITVRCIIY
jgi:hypothetical protein